MSTKYAFHPLAELFPLLEGREFTDLVRDIETHGQLEPIGLYEDMILDGRNRYLACESLGIEPRFETLSFISRDAARDWVISHNAHRRHLAPGVKYEIIAEMLAKFPNLSDRAIAEKAGTNPMRVGRIRKRTGLHKRVRTGRDGKSYYVPSPLTEAEDPRTRGDEAERSGIRGRRQASSRGRGEDGQSRGRDKPQRDYSQAGSRECRAEEAIRPRRHRARGGEEPALLILRQHPDRRISDQER